MHGMVDFKSYARDGSGAGSSKSKNKKEKRKKIIRRRKFSGGGFIPALD